MADKARERFGNTSISIIETFTNTALLLNACDIAAKSYESRKDTVALSTTMYIPHEFKLPLDVDVVLNRTDLMQKYRVPLLHTLCKDFLVSAISRIDACFEDIYDDIISTLEPTVAENTRLNRVRSSWRIAGNGRTELFNYLTDKAGLKSPASSRSTVDMVFDRYEELREIRHALVHTNGILSEKHLVRLATLRDRLPATLQKSSLASASFLKTGVIQLGVSELYVIRHWMYSTIIGYFHVAFQESCESLN